MGAKKRRKKKTRFIARPAKGRSGISCVHDDRRAVRDRMTEPAAKLLALRINTRKRNRDVTAYHCPTCQCWHVGRRSERDDPTLAEIGEPEYGEPVG